MRSAFVTLKEDPLIFLIQKDTELKIASSWISMSGYTVHNRLIKSLLRVETFMFLAK